MQHQEADNVDKLRNFLEDQGFYTEESSNGIRLRLDTGHVVDINALIRDSDFFWASFETSKGSSEKIKAAINDIRKAMVEALLGIATIGEFEETQDSEEKLVFVADIQLLPSLVYHGVVSLEDAPAKPEPELKPEPDLEDDGHQRHQPMPENLNGLEEAEQTPERMTADKAMELLESIDGKMLRQSLDMMNLRRSSTVRIALTRIFRSATDSKELMLAIQEEAEKITAPEDRDELEMVRIVSVNGFLQPVVELLCQEVLGRK